MTLAEIQALKMRRLTRPNPRPSKANPTIPYTIGDAVESDTAIVRRNDTGYDVTIKATGARYNCPTAESALAKATGGSAKPAQSQRGSRAATMMAQAPEDDSDA